MNSGLTSNDWAMLSTIVLGLLSGASAILLKVTAHWIGKHEGEVEKVRDHIKELEKTRFICENIHQGNMRDMERDFRREFVLKSDMERIEAKLDVIGERIQTLWDRVSNLGTGQR